MAVVVFVLFGVFALGGSGAEDFAFLQAAVMAVCVAMAVMILFGRAMSPALTADKAAAVLPVGFAENIILNNTHDDKGANDEKANGGRKKRGWESLMVRGKYYFAVVAILAGMLLGFIFDDDNSSDNPVVSFLDHPVSDVLFSFILIGGCAFYLYKTGQGSPRMLRRLWQSYMKDIAKIEVFFCALAAIVFFVIWLIY